MVDWMLDFFFRRDVTILKTVLEENEGESERST